MLLLCAGNAWALNKVTVTAATGGSAISADSTGGSYTTLSGPTAAESTAGNIGAGTIIFTPPSGFIFNPGATVTVTVTAGSTTMADNINGLAVNGTFSAFVAADGSTITTTITNAAHSSTANTIQWSNIQVRPTAGTPLASGNMTESGTSTLSGLNLSSGTWAALTEVAGATVKMVVTLPAQTFTSGTGNSGSVTAQTAGTSFNISKLTATDQFTNTATGYSGSKTITWSGPGGSPTYTTTVSFTSGQSTTTLTTTLRKAETVNITATDGTLTGVPSSPLTINPGTINHLQTLVPGETAAPGTSSGQTGSPSTQTAGVPFTVTVSAVDTNFNVINTNDTIHITSSDPAAVLPSNAALSAGTQTFSVTLKTASSQTVSSSDVTHAGTAGDTSDAVPLNAASPALVRVETAANGSGTIVPAQMVVVGQSLTVYSISRDAFTNFISNLAADSWSLTNVTGGVVNGDLVTAGDSKSATFTAHAVGSANIHAPSGGLSATDSGTLTVTNANTTTTLASSTNPTVFGQSVTFTATVNPVAPGAGAPSGTVTFKDGAATLGTGTIFSGQASLSTASLTSGAHSITAVYNGDSSFNTSTSSAVPQTVNKDNTTTSLVSSTNPIVFGQSVTFTATINPTAPGSGTPTGTVTFKDGATALTTNALVGGSASYISASLSAGAHSVTAVYNGDSNYNTSTNSPALSETVTQDSSTTALSSSANPSVFGQAVVFTVSVSANAPGAGTATGTVTLKDGATPLSTNTLSGGTVNYTNSALAMGSHSISAVYNGDANFSTSTSGTVTQAVNQANTTVSVNSSAAPSVFGQSVTFTATVTAAAPGSGTPTGTVQFSIDGTVFGSPVTLSGGAATSSATSSLAVGDHTITAVYSGSSSFVGSDNTASPLTQTVNPANTTGTVTSSTNPSVFGQSVSFTATISAVSPGTGTPTGTVTFKDGGTSLATRPLNGSGQASLNTASLGVAVHSITAVYNGDGNYNPTTSAALSQTVNQAATTTAISSSANPSVFGQSVTFTATVTAQPPGGGTASGTVTFKDAGNTLGTGSLSGGQATFTTSTLSIGSHSITAVYNGDSSFNSSTSSALTQTVNKDSSSVSVASSTNPSVFGQAVILTATVSAVAPGSGTPTGTVIFKDGATSLATNTLSAGQASYTNSAFSVGSHSITVVYNGDSTFNPSTSGTLTQTVNQDNTATVLSSSTNPTVFGQAVVFTAAVSAAAPGSGTPTGTVTFSDGATALATNNLSSGQANYTNSTLAGGTHSITAVYNGDGNFLTSTSGTITQTVNQASTSLALSSSANPSVLGQSITFGVTVSAVAPGSGTPTGTVQFSIDGSAFGSPVSLSGGSATSAATTALSVGSHSVTVAYAGDSNFNANNSSTLTQTVNQDNTSTSLSWSPNPSVFGQSVSFSATVSPVAPGSGTPTGNVAFKEGTNTLGNVALSAGQATFNISSLSVGGHSITAVFGGDTNFATSSSATASQTVNKDNTATSLASSTNPTVFGQSVTFTAAVSASAPGAGTPTGTVTFKDGASALSTNSLSGGTATFTTSSLSIASHSITAVYNGDGNFNASTSSALTQTVNQDNSLTALSSSTNPTVYGQAIVFTASVSAVAPGTNTPTGTITFKDGATSLSTNTLAAGTVNYTNTTLGAGSHSIIAVYNGDSGNSSSISGTVTQVVNQANSSSTVASSANRSVFGQLVTFTATVSAVAPGGNTPTGSVIFQNGATALATNNLSGGSATYATSAFSVAAHTITVVYGGDSNFIGSDNTGSPLTQTVNPANSTSSLASSTNPTAFGQSVTFTATVSAVAPGSGTPTGTVTFKDGATAVATNNLNGSGQATLVTASLSAGPHPISAVYNSDGNYNASTSGTVTQTVNQAGTATALTSSTNPSVFGQSVTFTATVTPTGAGAGTPGGTVTFKDGATTIGTGTLSSGQATFSTTSLSVAAHSITAVYGGDSSFTASTSSAVTQTVNKGGSATVVASSVNPSVWGQSVTLTATVTPTGAAGGTPTGTITFKDGATSLATNNLSGGSATYTSSAFSVASHSITAVYSGDGNFTNSTSSALTQTVNKSDTTAAITSSTNPSVFGQAIVFTASVSASSPGSGIPTGSVVFKDGATSLSTNTLSGGQVNYTNAALSVGAHSLTIVYNGDGNFNTNTSAVVTQTVNQANSMSTVASLANPSVFGQSVTFTATVSAAAPGAGTPTGTVVFQDGGTPLATNTLSGGSATYATAALSVAAHPITVVYNGDGNFLTSSSSTLTQTVNQANSSTALSSSTNPSVFGQLVTFTATVSAVAPGSGTASGTVTFKDGGTSLGTGTLNSGQATFSTAVLSVAAHSITAVYGGDGNFLTSTSGTVTQTVSKANSSTAVASSVNPSVSGQSVTFTATVTASAPGAGTPTGTVTFKDGATTLGTGTLSSGQATFSTSSLSVAAHSITAAYGSDGNFNASTSSALTQTVNQDSSATTLSSSTNPTVYGQAVVFTASVSANSPGSGTPTGTVTFKNGATSLSTNALSGGTVNYTNTTLAAGTHSITAVYNADSNFSTSTSGAVTQVVNQANSSSTVASSANPSVFGQSVTFTATVSAVAPGGNTPTGTVTFMDGPATLGTGTLSLGQATFTTNALTVAAHSITVVYGGDSNFVGSDDSGSPLTQTVNTDNTVSTVASVTNPSVFGQSVTFTATVSATAPGSGTPTGTVTFKDGVTPLATNGLSSGQATFSTSSLSVTAHSITVVYSGDGNFNASTSGTLTQTVNQAGTATALTSSTNPTVFGQSVTFTATVTPSGAGAGTPTGTVTFKDGATTIGTGNLSSGQASFSTSALSVASHTITAVYSGDGNFTTSTSAGVTQNVSKSASASAVASSTNPSVSGQSVTFTATVSAAAPGAGSPTGTVTFKDGATSLATNTLSGGAVTYTTSSLNAGSHSITVVYNGDGNFNTSTSSVLTQTVNQDSSTTTLTSSTNPTVFGQSVIFTATVSAVAPGNGTPTGTVTFKDGAIAISTNTLSGGSASLSTSALALGSHSISAVYNGDSNFTTNTSGAVTQVVNQAGSSTTVASSVNPSVFGQSVTFTATVSASAPGAGTPTGTVVFKDGATPLATNSLSSGQTTFSTSSLSAASHSITVVYNGDSNFTASTSAALNQTVNKDATSTTVASSRNPSLAQDPVTFTATVSASAPGAGTPTGTVQFTIDGTNYGGGVTLTGGTASSAATTSLVQGSHSITAIYSSDANFNTSTSATLTQTVNAVQITAATGGGAISADGAASGAFTTLTGPVYTESTGGNAGTGTMILNVASGFIFDTGGTAPTVVVTRITGGGGAANNINGVTSGSAVAMTTVTSTQLVFTVTSSSASGDPCSLTWQNVRVRPTAGTPLASGNMRMTGTANVVGLSTNSNCGTLQEVAGAAALLVIQQQPSPTATAGVIFAQQPVLAVEDQFGTLRNAANGSADNSTTVTATRSAGSGTLQGSTSQKASNGIVTYTNLSHLVATNITILFSGTGLTNVTSSAIAISPAAASALAFTAQPGNAVVGSIFGTQPALASQDAFGNNSTVGLPSNLSVNVALTSGTGPLQGTTTQDIGTAGGNGTVGYTNLRIDAAGTNKQLTATAAGLGNVLSAVFTVAPASSTTTVASSTNPIVSGQSVTFTATVNVPAGSGTPTGTVTFKDGATTLGSGTVTSSQASLTTTSLAVGSRSITATYNGDSNYSSSTSSALTETVTQDSSAIALTSSTNPTVFGQAVVFTASVSAVSPGSGTPTGTVTFKDGTTPLSTNTLSGGTLNYTNSALSVASHPITAVYSGDNNFATSTSATVTQTVNQAGSTTTVASSANPSVFGQSVSFTATVSAASPGAGTPTGTVQFSLDGSPFGSPVNLSAGSATSSATSSLSVGPHTVSVVYNGDTNFITSASSTLTQTVNQASSTTALITSTNPTVFGQSVTFTATVSAVTPGAGTATGIVTFKDGATPLATNILSSGQATLSTSALSVAAHSITVVYSGDSNFNASTSGTLTQTVNKANTTTSVASSANPSVSGQSVTFTATVTPSGAGAGTPTGTVTFKDGATSLATNNLSSGQAAFTTASLSVGSHSITAVYSADSSFNTSTSSILTQTVNQDSSSTILSSSTNPTVYGQAVVFTASVSANSPGSGTPTGTVTFKDGTTSLSTNTLTAGSVNYTNSTLAAGTHSITAVYNADSNFSTNTSGVVTQVVSQASTIASVTSSTNPTVFGQSVVLTATVAAIAPGGNTPAGNVIFQDGATALATNTLNGSGQATFTTASFAVGSHSITIVYNGTANFVGSTSSTLTQNVNQAATTTTVASSANPSVSGQSVAFTATVNAVSPGAGTRTGTVQFSIDGSPFGGPVTLSGGTATSGAIASLSAAAHTITAVYSGDSNFTGSDNTASLLTQTVNKDATTTTLVSSTNPVTFSQPVTFTATVTANAPGSGTPTGTVTFKDGATPLATNNLVSGQATFTTSSLAQGSHSMTAVYNADTSFNTSTSATLTEIVTGLSTTTLLTSSTNPSVSGQVVVLTASVTSPSNPVTGTVTFKDGTTSLATNTLNGSALAFYTNTAFSVGSHPLTAIYNGDATHSSSTNSPALIQAINKSDSISALTSSTNPSVFGQAIVFTVSVSAVLPGAGIPGGTVVFRDGATSLRTNTLASGQTSYTNTTLSAGSHTITAVYNGDGNFNTNTSSALPQTVNVAGTTTTIASSANPSAFGQPVTFTATVNPVAPGAGTRTGTVQFVVDGSNFGAPVTLSGGTATTSTSSLSLGSHTVSAVYSGDSNFTGSSSANLNQTVNKGSTSTSVASSLNPAAVGQQVTFTATVAITSGAGTPSGTVQFKLDGTNLDGAISVSGNTASIDASSVLTQGSHTVAAVYSGDSNFNTSTSANLTQTMNGSPLTAAIGGTNISADATGVSYTNLSGPAYLEPSSGSVLPGTITLNAPAGFIFNTNAAITVLLNGSSSASANINNLTNGATIAATVTSNTITITITGKSTGNTPNQLTWQGIQVRPVSGAPLASGTITKSGTSSMTGETDGFTSWGSLVEVAGAAKQLVFTTQPGSTTYGSLLSPQPVVKSQDGFGNLSTLGLGASKALTLSLTSGTGSLAGTTSLDIGTNVGNGIATFSGLSVNVAGSGKQLTASASGLTNAISSSFAVTQATVTASITASNKVYDATNTATIATRSLTGVISSDDVTCTGGTATFASKTVGTNKTVTATGLTLSGTTAPNYVLASTTATTTANITSASLTVVGVSANNRLYNATTNATLSGSASLSGMFSGDVVTLGGTPAASFANKAVGTNKVITVRGYTISGADSVNYSLSQPSGLTANITTAGLTVTGVTADDKAYDGATNATIHTAGAVLVGVFSGDNVTLNGTGATGNFSDPNVGTNKTVFVSGLTLNGLDAPNYTLAQPITTASIANAFATVAGIIASNKVYDATATASINTNHAVLLGIASGDQVTLIFTNAAGEFDSKNVGTNKTVVITGLFLAGPDAGKYALPEPLTNANIGVATLTVTGITADKVYDATTNATLNTGGAALVGVFGGDLVSLTTSNVVAHFADKNVGTNKTVSVSGLALAGPDSANYILSQPAVTANITQSGLSVSGVSANNKPYDGTTAATLNTNSAALAGVFAGDDVALNTAGVSGAFANATAGTAKPVTILGLTISGADSGNYSLTQPSATANITGAALTVAAVDKIRGYGSTNPVLTVAYSGFVNGEGTNVLSGAPSVATTANTNSPVGAYQIEVNTGTLSNPNYSFSFTNGTLTVTQAVLIATANDQTRIYGTTNLLLSVSYSGFVNGEDTNILSGSPTVSTADPTSPIGTYPISLSQGTLSTSDTNYAFRLVPGTLTITPAGLTVTADSQSKVFGQADPALTYQVTSGTLVNGDTLNGGLTRESGEAVGVYAILQGTLAASSNYSLSYIGANLTILSANSAVVVTTSANPSPTWSNVTFMATVSAVAPGNGTPSGSVQFLADGVALGSPVALSAGTATTSTSTLSHGYHTIAATYAGDSSFLGSSNAMASAELINTAPVAGLHTCATTENQPVSISISKLVTRDSDPDGDPLHLVSVSVTSTNGGTVVTNATTITYTPPTNYYGVDAFTYTVGDNFDATAVATVQVTIRPLNVSIVITDITQLPDGNYEIQSSGVAGSNYWLEATSDLHTWTTIQTNAANANGVITFTDLSATNYASRFYRTAAP